MARLLLIVGLLAGTSLFAQDPQNAQEEEEKKVEASSKTQTEHSSKDPSLVELARQSREEREKSGDEVRVITNKDLFQMRSSRVTTSKAPPREKTAGGEGGSGDESEEEAVEEGEPTGPDMEEWTQAFREARANLQGAVNQTLVLELRLNNLRNAYFRQDDGSTAEMLQSQLAKTNEELQNARRSEEEARGTLEQLEREALAAGLSPGEVRSLKGEIKKSSSIVDLTPEQAAEMPR